MAPVLKPTITCPTRSSLTQRETRTAHLGIVLLPIPDSESTVGLIRVYKILHYSHYSLVNITCEGHLLMSLNTLFYVPVRSNRSRSPRRRPAACRIKHSSCATPHSNSWSDASQLSNIFLALQTFFRRFFGFGRFCSIGQRKPISARGLLALSASVALIDEWAEAGRKTPSVIVITENHSQGGRSMASSEQRDRGRLVVNHVFIRAYTDDTDSHCLRLKIKRRQ